MCPKIALSIHSVTKTVVVKPVLVCQCVDVNVFVYIVGTKSSLYQEGDHSSRILKSIIVEAKCVHS